VQDIDNFFARIVGFSEFANANMLTDGPKPQVAKELL